MHESLNISEPNSTLEQTSLNAVGRDSVPELGLREVNIVLQKNVLGRRQKNGQHLIRLVEKWVKIVTK